MIAFIEKTKASIEKRKRYARLVAEIDALSDRDLADFNGNRDDILRHIWVDIYGK